MSKKVQTEIMLGNEEACLMVGELTESDLLELAGVDIHSGKHSIHGNVRLVIPSMGECVLLLPLELQAA